MSDVIVETLDGLVLKGLPKAETLEASLEAYTKPNLIKLAKENDFDVKQSWNKDQMIEVISEGLKASVDERFAKFEAEELSALKELLEGKTEEAKNHKEIIASAVNQGILYVSEDNDDLAFTMPKEFVGQLDKVEEKVEPVEKAEKPADKVKEATRPIPYTTRRRRTQEVEQRIIGEKVGRNDPCPCGSGKKYKKCHWTEHQKDGVTASY